MRMGGGRYTYTVWVGMCTPPRGECHIPPAVTYETNGIYIHAV